MRRCFRLAWMTGFLAVLAAGAWPAAASAQEQQPQPQPKRYNILFILTDDQAQWAVGAYGNKEIKTPNMDRLAAEGALFLNAHVPTPVCSPSRAGLLTGLYGTEVGITDWISPEEAEAGLGLSADFTNWVQVLQRNGYYTGLVGKWHLGTQEKYHPTRLGFDAFLGFLGGGNQPMDPVLEINGKEQKVKGPTPDLLATAAITFLENRKLANLEAEKFKQPVQPFALLVHFRAPHLPYGPVPQEDSDAVKDLDPTIPNVKGLDVAQVKKWMRDYYASIHSVDRNIGRILQSLQDLGFAEDTIVIFTSDHGYNIGHHGIHTKGNGNWILGGVNGPKRPNMWGTSTRIPLIIRWPGVVKGGMRIEQMISSLDMFPSVLNMLTVPMPQGVRQHGMDFSPLLRGENVVGRTELFGQYDLHNGGLAFMRSIRTPDYLLVRHFFSNGQDELYDLRNDPEETKNVYNNPNYLPAREQLESRLAQWQRSINDPILRSSWLQPVNRRQ